MKRSYRLHRWDAPSNVELCDTRFPNYDPRYRTGMMVYAYGGWQWTTEDGSVYRTNSEGEGLWLWIESEACYRQQLGTCQFSLPENRAAARRRLQHAGYRLSYGLDKEAVS